MARRSGSGLQCRSRTIRRQIGLSWSALAADRLAPLLGQFVVFRFHYTSDELQMEIEPNVAWGPATVTTITGRVAGIDHA